MSDFIVVTGATGFIGTHLMRYLLDKERKVVGLYYLEGEKKRFRHFVKEKITLLKCDIRDYNRLYRIIKKYEPCEIYHLAAQSYPTVSYHKPRLTICTNAGGTVNVFECVKKLKLSTKILVAGSSAVYGIVDEKDVPVKEERILKPVHPYGVSKVAQELLAYQYYKNYGIETVVPRIFNTTGPGKVKDVCSDFSSRIARAEKKGVRYIRVGNLNAKRDITDVRDCVRGLAAVMEHGKSGEVYNLCSSKAYLINDLLEMLLKMSKIKIKPKVDENLLRPVDEKIILGDNTKIKNECNWSPKISIEKTLQDTLDYWR